MPETKAEIGAETEVYGYRIEPLPADLAARVQVMNDLGKDGWVLVQVVTAANTLGYFARKLSMPEVP